MERKFENVNKIVIKVGTSSITHQNGTLNLKQIDKLARIISDLFNNSKQIILVSSGAIGAGVSRLNLGERPKRIAEKQAVACVGQNALMEIYNKVFADYGYNVGQLLLSKFVFDNPKFSDNAKETLNQLLKMRVIPIVNENDSISADEIKFGDNDNLSSYVAQLVDADMLILLSDIDGLYDKNPKEYTDAKFIECADNLSADFIKSLETTTSSFGTGGIITKVNAGVLCSKAGIDVVLASSANLDVIYDILSNKNVGTYFPKLK